MEGLLEVQEGDSHPGTCPPSGTTERGLTLPFPERTEVLVFVVKSRPRPEEDFELEFPHPGGISSGSKESRISVELTGSISL